jgi:glycosyltransferase involved in cell wall biosynthesis
VDDGSTDRTKEVLAPYSEQFVYIYQENKGVAAARNTGIRVAKGKYIAFLDSDDIWMPKKLELQVDYLNKHANIALVYGDYTTFDETGTIEENFASSRGLQRPSGYIFRELLLKCLFQTSTVVIREEVLKAVGLFDERYLKGEDYDLWLRVAAKHQIGYLESVVAKYRQHSSSMTHNFSIGKPWQVQVIESVLRRFPEQKAKLTTYELRTRLAAPYLTIGYAAFYKKEYSVARYHFSRCLLMWPFNTRALVYFCACLVAPYFTS